MIKSFFFFICVLWLMLFVLASSKPELPKASSFNEAIKERNQGDERATFYDKQSVRNILKAGCLPDIPKDTNKNITALCDPS